MADRHQSQTMSEQLESMVDRMKDSEQFAVEEAKFEISEMIAALMEARGMRKADLAKRLGSSLPYVTKILRGDANFTIESLVKIARAFDMTLNLNEIFAVRHTSAPSGKSMSSSVKPSRATRTTPAPAIRRVRKSGSS